VLSRPSSLVALKESLVLGASTMRLIGRWGLGGREGRTQTYTPHIHFEESYGNEGAAGVVSRAEKAHVKIKGAVGGQGATVEKIARERQERTNAW
jgi:hypothetical protein